MLWPRMLACTVSLVEGKERSQGSSSRAGTGKMSRRVCRYVYSCNKLHCVKQDNNGRIDFSVPVSRKAATPDPAACFLPL